LHPVLAWGPQAERITAGHEQLQCSCGPGSPFEKMLELDTKVLLFDVGFEVFGFWHYLEHRFKERAPVSLYSRVPLEGTLIDEEGRTRKLPLCVFDQEAIRRRNYSVLKTALARARCLARARIGNTRLMLARGSDALRCTEALYEGGVTLYQ
jgi:aminoglycoside 3-N-acetyltransferase